MDYLGYGYNYSPSYGNYEDAIMGLFFASYTFTIVFSFLIAIFTIICLWKIFEKAGKPGWASLIPIYNMWILFEIVGMNGALSLLVFIPFVGVVIVGVLSIIAYIKLAKAFGKDTGFAVGLILVCPVFLAILAFDKSTYLGVSNN